MKYRFATEKLDYSDFASGRVFYSAPGHPVFPVRLASEIFQRCLAIRHSQGAAEPCVLYDPCCGSAYHLSILAYLHWQAIAAIIGSDIDSAILATAERNLALLTVAGMESRIAAIAKLLAAYGKASHVEAMASAEKLKRRLIRLRHTHQLETSLFLADATDSRALAQKLDRKVDIVLTDIPYGWLSTWQVVDIALSPVQQMLEALGPVLSRRAVVAIAADKRQKIGHQAYRRVERFLAGKRQIVLLQSEIEG